MSTQPRARKPQSCLHYPAPIVVYFVTFTKTADCAEHDTKESTHTSGPRLAATREAAEDIVCREICNQMVCGCGIDSIARAGESTRLRDYQWLCETSDKEGWFKGRHCPNTFSWEIVRRETEVIDFYD